MLLDWLAQEGWIVFNWWLLATIASITVLPLMLRLLNGLPDRGYTLARPAGILLIAFVFWILGVLGFINNSPGSIALTWIIVLFVSLSVFFSSSEVFDVQIWWQENRRVVIVTEILFVVLLLGWAVVRAHQNSIIGTEKPMDLAFMSAALQGDTLPPHDPWLSGYIISYYYFGYVMAAMFSMMSGVWTTIGYNMHIAMLFALTGVASFGIVYNLVRSRAMKAKNNLGELTILGGEPSSNKAILFGLLGMVFIILLGNFHTAIVELPYRNQWASESYLNFWDTKSRNTYGGKTDTDNLLDPNDGNATFWWWFDAARSSRDLRLDGEHIEVIAEFPQFSFLLADSHPHVMALPYVLLAMGLSINVLLSYEKPDTKRVLFYGICVGALVFLNTWDVPIYLGLLVAADALRRIGRWSQLRFADWVELFIFGISLVAITLVAYLPFLVGFQSQLGGILPNLLHSTRFQQIFLIFGPFIVLLLFFVAVEVWRGNHQRVFNGNLGLKVVGSILLVLIFVIAALALGSRLSAPVWASIQQFVTDNGGWDTARNQFIERRISPLRLMTTIVMLLSIGLIVSRLFPPIKSESQNDASQEISAYPLATGFVLLLVGVGAALVLIPEFVYLRDNFSTRMNTVFKFYYQAWIAFGIASAYASYTILTDVQEVRPLRIVRVIYSGVLAVVLFAGLLYPAIGIYHRMFIETGRLRSESPPALTLDGGQSVTYHDDYQALVCLRDFVQDGETIVLEATHPGSYDGNDGGRVAVGGLTGLQTVIGWQGHQRQWRGNAYGVSVGTRPSDVMTIYQDLRLDVVIPLIEKYEINYILYGTTERIRYGSGGEDKFRDVFDVVCESGNSRVYRVNTSIDVVAQQ